jgi:hypothetical protein
MVGLHGYRRRLWMIQLLARREQVKARDPDTPTIMAATREQKKRLKQNQSQAIAA